MNVKRTLLSIGYALVLAIAPALRAQSGCVDSPEDPTLVLGLVGGAGVFAATLWNAHRKR
jgi:XrtJ-associated TM-motif-TM protein